MTKLAAAWKHHHPQPLFYPLTTPTPISAHLNSTLRHQQQTESSPQKSYKKGGFDIASLLAFDDKSTSSPRGNKPQCDRAEICQSDASADVISSKQVLCEDDDTCCDDSDVEVDDDDDGAKYNDTLACESE